jgi:Na+/H+-dicarboxylate symporter
MLINRFVAGHCLPRKLPREIAMSRLHANVILSNRNGAFMREPNETSDARDLTALMPDIRVPASRTFAGLVGGIALGLLLGGKPLLAPVLTVAEPVGILWLRALQMTIIPLVAALLVVGVIQTMAAARAGAMARRTLGLFFTFLAGGAALAGLLMPPLLEAFPIPARAAEALRANVANPGPVPGVAEFLQSLVPTNIVDAAAKDAVLPLILFFTLFALATTRLPTVPRRLLADLFAAIAGTMMVMIGWVLALAPFGVFALGLGLASRSGSAAIAALTHYILLVSGLGGIVMLAAYALAAVGARLRVGAFARAMLPVQAVAFSTQSSLASLPAMLGACRVLGVRGASADFVLPLAVALFRATGPAMNLAVAIYVAKLTGVALTPPVLAAGFAVAILTTLGAVSLPGAISFVTSIGPIALAMGVPVGPLAILVAVEMLPDIMRTVSNVTMDVAVTATVDRRTATD